MFLFCFLVLTFLLCFVFHRQIVSVFLKWVSTCPFLQQEQQRKREKQRKISFQCFGLNGKDNTYCKQAITLAIKYGREYNYLADI